MCPIYKKTNKIVINGHEIDLTRSDALCNNALSSLLHYAVALREGVDPITPGLSKKDDCAYIQCLNPEKPYTKGGTAIFRCKVD